MHVNNEMLQSFQKIILISCSSEIECDWNDELLIINEDIRHIQNDYVIIFFEIVDILSTNRNLELIGKQTLTHSTIEKDSSIYLSSNS